MEFCKLHQEVKVLYGIKWKCKSCNRVYQRKWFSDNKAVQLQRVKRNSQSAKKRNRERLWKYFEDHPCVDCGESDPVVLDCDHVGEKKYNVSNMLTLSWESIVRELQNCEIRCANCHRKKTARERNYYNSAG